MPAANELGIERISNPRFLYARPGMGTYQLTLQKRSDCSSELKPLWPGLQPPLE